MIDITIGSDHKFIVVDCYIDLCSCFKFQNSVILQ